MARFVHPIQSEYRVHKDYSKEYQTYLQQQEFVSDISSAISSAGNQYSQTIVNVGKNIAGEIQNMSKMQCEAIQQSTNQIVGALDKGFNHLANTMQKGFNEVNRNLTDIKFQLQDIENAIDKLGGLIDSKLNAVIEQQYITNLGISQLIAISKIPEFQKERIYYFEEGLKFLNNALIDPRRYTDALDNFLEAEKRKKTDYIVLYQIGLIHLFSSDNLDLEKAEDYFLKAGDYADDELDPKAIRSNQINFSGENVSSGLVTKIAYESYQNAAYAQLIMGKFSEASTTANKAIQISKNALEAKYIKAQALVALGKSKDALNSISELSIDPNYLIEASFNPDIAAIDGFQDLLKERRNDIGNQIAKKLQSILLLMDENSPVGRKSKILLESSKSEPTLLNLLKILQETS